VAVRLRVNGWPCVNGYAGTAALCMLSCILVLVRDQRNAAKYDYTRVTMAVKRCGCCAIPSVTPAWTAASLHPQRHRQVWSYLPTCAHPCHTDGGPPSRTRHRRPLSTASINGLSQRWELTSQQHRPDCVCVHYAVVHAIGIEDEQRQNAVNKRILKGRKTNPNLNVLFEVRIFGLHLTSLFQTIKCMMMKLGS